MHPSQLKRLRELRIGHPMFRRHPERIPPSTLRAWGLDFDPSFLASVDTGETTEELLWGYQDSLRPPELARGQDPKPQGGERDFHSWRKRQIGRFITQSPPRSWVRAPHAPFALELSLGCSLHCDFCGFDAPKLQAVARFTPDNESLFRTVLEVLEAFAGEDAKRGFLYWATEPLDNPDYEQYLLAFRDVLGTVPSTTTAAWNRKPGRTRRLLNLGREEGTGGSRFSVFSLEHFSECLTEFSPEELADVPLVLQYPGSLMETVAAGRGGIADETAVLGTIACVTGFLVNLVQKSIKLVTPSTDFRRWPLGYEVHREGQVRDGEELRAFLKGCARDLMRWELGDETVPRLRSDLSVDASRSDQVVLATPHCELTFEAPSECALLREMDGRRTVREIVLALMEEHDPARLYYDFGQLHDAGFFEREPPKGTPATP